MKILINNFRHLILSLFLLGLFGLLAGCQKEDPTPTYHKDIFRCKVNGVEWSATCPSTGLFGCEPIDCQYYWKDTKGFEIRALRRNNITSIRESIALFARPVVIGNNLTIFPRKNNFMNMKNSSDCIIYTIDSASTNYIDIVYIDTLNYLIEGSFEYTAINNCQDSVMVTDGYFFVTFRF